MQPDPGQVETLQTALLVVVLVVVGVLIFAGWAAYEGYKSEHG